MKSNKKVKTRGKRRSHIQKNKKFTQLLDFRALTTVLIWLGAHSRICNTNCY